MQLLAEDLSRNRSLSKEGKLHILLIIMKFFVTSLHELPDSVGLQQQSSTSKSLSLHSKLQWAGPTRIVFCGGAESKVREQRCRPLKKKDSFLQLLVAPESSRSEGAGPRISKRWICFEEEMKSTCSYKSTSHSFSAQPWPIFLLSAFSIELIFDRSPRLLRTG